MQTKLSLLDKISDKAVWHEFYAQKKESGYLSRQDDALLLDFIENKRYVPISDKIQHEGFYFDRPQIKLVNKSGTNKKRVVYCFKPDETLVLKLLASLLHKYDGYFCDFCFSFRKNLSVRRAVGNLIRQIRGKDLYCYKLDISNYFNSIDVDLLLPKLGEIFCDDSRLYEFFRDLLTWQDGGKHGVMAGTPTSPFFSNVFLTELDRHFFDLGVPYARYSDDIIVFAESEMQLQEYKNFIYDFLSKVGLRINTKKEQTILPQRAWQFLGIEYHNGEIDLSPVTKEKIKAKIRRKARSIARWKSKKAVPDEKALEVMTRVFNKKFFEDAGVGELTWSRWYFPLLTVDKGLNEVDLYLQMWLRFLKTGKHNKKNYEKAPYEYLKEHGYISLVHRFHEKRSD